jgi:hypothetical protein
MRDWIGRDAEFGTGRPAALPSAGDLGESGEDRWCGEFARFWFARPGANQVAVGPYAAESGSLTVRGACRSAGGTMTWKVFDNSEQAGTATDVRFLDQGQLTCDGATHQAAAEVGDQREVAILGLTGAPDGDDGDSGWLALANE